MIKYMTNPNLNLLWVNTKDLSGFVLTAINQDVYINLDLYSVIIEELIVFCNKERGQDDIIQHFKKHFKLEKDDIFYILELLVEKKLILSSEFKIFSNGWVKNYNVKYSDYSKTDTLLKDKEKMRSYLDEESSPPIIESYDGRKINLPLYPTESLLEKAFSIEEEMKEKGFSKKEFYNFLYYGFGAVKEAKFFDLMPVLLKFYPSNGARHVFELYIIAANISDLSKGLYHYNCLEHQLTYLGKIPEGCADINMILITSIFDRMQWRYRNSWNYRDILLEMGHLEAHLKLVSKVYNIKLEKCEKLPTFKVNEKSFLEEEIILAYKY
ncbi:SagB/ThcOx family dehydrogenase [Priestia flexa]|uniref:SagB/ThcOx family dehydrogenase n=1 Tax=Priestia flexa TaxID=86664 RepID=UPI000C24A6B5|nr:SagB/ThcOx family dehydrogenase [Priestia flexa]MEC0665826.1 SagB/ThcOx family dehydrogenase [Priestia flexa]